MAFSKRVPARAGDVTLHISTSLTDAIGTVGPLTGEIRYDLVDASGAFVGRDSKDVSELSAAQQTSLVNLLTSIRTRINTEAV